MADDGHVLELSSLLWSYGTTVTNSPTEDRTHSQTLKRCVRCLRNHQGRLDSEMLPQQLPNAYKKMNLGEGIVGRHDVRSLSTTTKKNKFSIQK